MQQMQVKFHHILSHRIKENLMCQHKTHADLLVSSRIHPPNFSHLFIRKTSNGWMESAQKQDEEDLRGGTSDTGGFVGQEHATHLHGDDDGEAKKSRSE